MFHHFSMVIDGSEDGGIHCLKLGEEEDDQHQKLHSLPPEIQSRTILVTLLDDDEEELETSKLLEDEDQ